MHEDADVALGVFGDRGNLDVSETVGPEVEGFALVSGKVVDQGSKQSMQISLFGQIRRIVYVAWAGLTVSRFAGGHGQPYGFSVGLFTPRSSQYIHRAVATN